MDEKRARHATHLAEQGFVGCLDGLTLIVVVVNEHL